MHMKPSFDRIVTAARSGVAALALACLASCGGGGGSTTPPFSISNLRFSPNSVVVGSASATISGTVDFSGASAALASLDLSTAAGGAQSFPIQGIAGQTSGTVSGQFQVSATTLGHYTFDISLVDGQGRSSNHLSGTFDVVINDLASNWRTVATGAGGLHRVIWTGAQFVAVGDGGAILVSPDGSTWTVEHSRTTNTLLNVAWSGSRLVAVGQPGTLITSTDGTTWTASALPVSSTTWLYGIAWSGTKFVAVGYDSNGTITTVTLVSSDGLNWTVGSSGQPYMLFSVIWNGRQFVAAGGASQSSAAPAVLRSADGQTWSADTVSVPGAHAISDISSAGSANNTTMVGVGSGPVLTSTVGAPWQATSTMGSALDAIGWSGAHFLGCGYNCVLSSDGVNWTTLSLPTGGLVNSLVWGGSGNGRWIAVGLNGVILASP